jgi:hypothetical protein
VGNEENEYPLADHNRMISISNELNDIHKEMIKEEFKNELIEIVMEDLQENLKKNTQNQLKEYQDNRNKKLERT